MNNQENDGLVVIEDMPVDETQQAEVKGGRGVLTYTYTVNNTSSAD